MFEMCDTALYMASSDIESTAASLLALCGCGEIVAMFADGSGRNIGTKGSR
jgi:hypothetical protein